MIIAPSIESGTLVQLRPLIPRARFLGRCPVTGMQAWISGILHAPHRLPGADDACSNEHEASG
jgi:hypothetical protein